MGVILPLRFFLAAMRKHFKQYAYPLAATVVGKHKGKETNQIVCPLPDRLPLHIQADVSKGRIPCGCLHIQAPASKSSPTRRAALPPDK